MFRKILVILGFVAVCLLFSGYFYCAEYFSSQDTARLTCNKIKVVIKTAKARTL